LLRAYPKSNFVVIGAHFARTNNHIPFSFLWIDTQDLLKIELGANL
jgi:hypothetical protein